jgi:hypothetical protein
MKKSKTILAGVLLGTMLATPVLAAAEEACVQHNRVWGWRALDEHTLQITDRTQHRFIVHLDGFCGGLTSGAAVLVFRTWTNLGCLAPGDLIGVRSPGLGFVSCQIANVQAAAA